MTVSHDSFVYKVISAIGQWMIKCIEAIMVVFAREKGSIMNVADYPWANNIEENTPLITAELNKLLQNYEAIPSIEDLSKEQKRIISGQQTWKTFMLYAYSAAFERNIAQCPNTVSVIKQIPGMTTAFFSILEPHTKLTPHRGPYKGVLRYHLALIVPEPITSCGIMVNGETHHWQVGKSLIFDDTYMHQAWNNSDENRVVLFIDFKRKFIFPINIFNDFMIWLIGVSPFISNAMKKIEKGK